MGRGETNGAAKDHESRRVDDLGAGAEDHQNPGKTEDDGNDAPGIHTFAQENHGQDGGPDGNGEFDGKDFGQRQQRDAVNPTELSAEMKDIAHHMQLQAAGLPGRGSVLGQQGQQQKEADETAEKKDFEGLQGVRQLAHGNRHGHERR